MTPDGARIAGIIAEYNPYHNGHLYQMRKARSTTGAPWCIVLLSGSFVQRGEPAVLPMHERAEKALHAGADLVLQLPDAFPGIFPDSIRHGNHAQRLSVFRKEQRSLALFRQCFSLPYQFLRHIHQAADIAAAAAVKLLPSDSAFQSVSGQGPEI